MYYKNFKKRFISLRILAFVAVIGFALTANAQRECNRCEGTGELEEYCPSCKGHGEKYCSTCGGHGVRNCGFCFGSGTMRCGYCRGRGVVNKDTEYCPKCEGSGKDDCENCSGRGKIPCPERSCDNGVVPCRSCNATGIHKWRCPDCRGTGQVRR